MANNNGLNSVFDWIGVSKRGDAGAPIGPAAVSPRPAATRSVSALRAPRRGQDITQIMTFQPKGLAESAEIANVFRDNIPVIVNVVDLPKEEQRRLFDFLLGLKAGLEGNIKRVTQHVFLLSPSSVIVNDEDEEPVTDIDASDDLDIRRP
jgi:FtsZ-interacting cell division protein YlmF